MAVNTWWFAPDSQWAKTTVISGVSRACPAISGVATHLITWVNQPVIPSLDIKHLHSMFSNMYKYVASPPLNHGSLGVFNIRGTGLINKPSFHLEVKHLLSKKISLIFAIEALHDLLLQFTNDHRTMENSGIIVHLCAYWHVPSV